ncbi:voltage-dependent anion-selective channel-like protein [Dinothrombium tinctorium]|uniref:Voltage-dependent anion-selective channel-like protein n=1 Tax=Dinothrombium tinctorium TaxID=1965070 RepID=A0A3S3QSL3_9ACAR|nr:voltage-dependent anion-selective channel-like protein [Dinothrombium tinctorium]RWS12560.1 voltage-dependent anion-selective channel-like protein [Dinothrombium tinctorium]RWS13342.1 voltage-dependent anion-selective channel-like protein [Dinothrombium tinctorium]RWS13347.1 voltage-dependent anion-selective channel-like protein [Dinothrombium tinctorium]
MAPPCFGDLGKQARDLFTKNYHLGIIKLDVKTKTPSGVEFAVNGTSNNDTGRVTASLETKHTLKEYGLTLKEKWNTDNTLNTEITLEDKLMKGVKVGLNGSFAPQSGKKTGNFKSAFKHEFVHVNGDVDMDYAGVLLHGAVVLGYQGWLAGAQLSFEPSKNKLSKTNFSIGYQTPEFVLHTSLNDGQEFTGSVYQRVNEKLESGIQMAWSSANNTTRFGLGCVYKFDDDTSLRGKVNNNSQIGLGFTHRLRRGISLTLCALIDGKNFNQGGHKLGMGFELEA